MATLMAPSCVELGLKTFIIPLTNPVHFFCIAICGIWQDIITDPVGLATLSAASHILERP